MNGDADTFREVQRKRIKIKLDIDNSYWSFIQSEESNIKYYHNKCWTFINTKHLTTWHIITWNISGIDTKVCKKLTLTLPIMLSCYTLWKSFKVYSMFNTSDTIDIANFKLIKIIHNFSKVFKTFLNKQTYI